MIRVSVTQVNRKRKYLDIKYKYLDVLHAVDQSEEKVAISMRIRMELDQRSTVASSSRKATKRKPMKLSEIETEPGLEF